MSLAKKSFGMEWASALVSINVHISRLVGGGAFSLLMADWAAGELSASASEAKHVLSSSSAKTGTKR